MPVRDGLKTRRIGQSAAKARTAQGSTTIPTEGVGCKLLTAEAVGALLGEDIVYTPLKNGGGITAARG